MRLFEILHNLPQIMKEAESINPAANTTESSTDDTHRQLATLFQHCQKFETRLEQWFNDLESKYQSSHGGGQPLSDSAWSDTETGEALTPSSILYWCEPSTLYSLLPYDSPRRVFPFFICFVDPDIAFQVILHWAALLLMHSTVYMNYVRICRHIDEKESPRSPAFESPNSGRSLALLIAQSLEYFVHPDMGLMGTNLIGFPMSVAQGFFTYTGSKEILWFDVIFQRIREMKSGLGGFLDDMAKGDTVKLVAHPWRPRS
jgi:hypothetical protein